MRVLLVEDDSSTAKAIELSLASEGIICDTTELGEEGLEIGKIYDYDIIILDLMLPDIDGYEVLRRFRAARVTTPILILSGLSGPDQKIKGLGYGADDYLTKPFNKGELIARIQAIVRRSKGHSESIIRTGKIAVNLDTRTVEIDGKPVHLTSKEYAILELLSLRKGTILTKEMFLNHLYGGIDEPELKIIDVFVCKLRKKIAEATGGHHYIETVWGRGYVLRDPAAPWAAGASTLDENLAERIRDVLAGTGSVREVRMFGGLCFMLNGNMAAGASKRGLLVRVGKDQHARALARPDAERMEMFGRPMEGCVFIDPPPRDEQTLREWLNLAVAFVNTLAAKAPRLRSRRAKAK